VTISSFLSHLFHSPVPRLAIVTLIALAWSTSACKSPYSSGTIHDAAKAGDLARVKALLKKNPKLVSSRNIDSYGMTPLQVAAQEGHKDVAELLLANKADINAGDNLYGKTPLYIAVTNAHKSGQLSKMMRNYLCRHDDNSEKRCNYFPHHNKEQSKIYLYEGARRGHQ
jgi:ankyrin repeat protein